MRGLWLVGTAPTRILPRPLYIHPVGTAPPPRSFQMKISERVGAGGIGFVIALPHNPNKTVAESQCNPISPIPLPQINKQPSFTAEGRRRRLEGICGKERERGRERERERERPPCSGYGFRLKFHWRERGRERSR